MTRPHSFALAFLLPVLALPACASRSKGPPKVLPKVAVSSSAATPRHNMPRSEYPFDERGNYITTWAAEGSRGSGGTDYDFWRDSHGSGRRAAPASRTVSSPATSRSSSSTTAARATGSSSRPSTSSTVKKSTPSKTAVSTPSYHTVKSSDTLYGLALRYKTTVAKIKSANGLKSDLIRPGQKLKIAR